MDWLDQVKWPADGLVAAIAQDAASGKVLTLAWMNREALARTAETGEAHYWSRSRGRLWRKGESSGHVQRVRESGSTATTTRSCSTSNRRAASPVTRDASAAFSSAWKTIAGWRSSR